MGAEPWAIALLVSGVVGTFVASVIFLQRPSAVQNRAVALFVWMVSLGWAFLYGPVVFARPDPWLGPGVKTGYVAFTLAVVAYLWILSTLDSPLARPLAHPWVRGAYTLILSGLATIIAVTPLARWFGTGVDPSLVFDLAWMLVMLFGIAVAVSAWRRAPSGLLRRKNGAFAMAFVVHDVTMVLFLAGVWLQSFVYQWFGPVLPETGLWFVAVPGFALLLFQALLLYGILSAQLFDIDLKLRWGVSRGTVGAIFVAAFFAASEIVAAVLSPRIGVVAGILATALLVIAFAPLRRVADAFARWVVRDATDTPAYRKSRKEMVYVAQVEELMADQTISAKERRALLRLQQSLGLNAAVAARLELDVLDRLAGREG